MSELRVRRVLGDYLSGKVSLAQLTRALPDGWELDEAEDASLRSLTFSVMGAISEFDRGDLTEAELRDRLVPLVGFLITHSEATSGTAAATAGPTRIVAAGTALLAASS
jgi:hypothetical protein